MDFAVPPVGVSRKRALPHEAVISARGTVTRVWGKGKTCRRAPKPEPHAQRSLMTDLPDPRGWLDATSKAEDWTGCRLVEWHRKKPARAQTRRGARSPRSLSAACLLWAGQTSALTRATTFDSRSDRVAPAVGRRAGADVAPPPPRSPSRHRTRSAAGPAAWQMSSGGGFAVSSQAPGTGGEG